MSRLYPLFFAIILGASPRADAQFRPIKLGYVDFPPFTYKKNGEPAGLLIDAVRPLMKKAGVSMISAELYPAGRLFRLLKSGEVDMWIGIELHKDAIAYTRNSLAMLELDVWVLKGKPLPKIKTVEDLRPFRLALLGGYGYGEWGARIRDPRAAFRWTDLTDRYQAFKFLTHNRADILLDYKDPLMETLPRDMLKELHHVKVQELNVKIGISRSYPKYRELIAAFNAQMDGT